MGNPDLIIIINNGEKSFLIKGTKYARRRGAVELAFNEWDKWVREVEELADKPEELFFEIKQVMIVEL